VKVTGSKIFAAFQQKSILTFIKFEVDSSYGVVNTPTQIQIKDLTDDWSIVPGTP
jgi:hypothetical protein